jgi:hypothetical protein
VKEQVLVKDHELMVSPMKHWQTKWKVTTIYASQQMKQLAVVNRENPRA